MFDFNGDGRVDFEDNFVAFFLMDDEDADHEDDYIDEWEDDEDDVF